MRRFGAQLTVGCESCSQIVTRTIAASTIVSSCFRVYGCGQKTSVVTTALSHFLHNSSGETTTSTPLQPPEISLIRKCSFFRYIPYFRTLEITSIGLHSSSFATQANSKDKSNNWLSVEDLASSLEGLGDDQRVEGFLQPKRFRLAGKNLYALLKRLAQKGPETGVKNQRRLDVEVIKWAKKAKVPLDAHHYSVVINASGRSEDLSSAFELFEEARSARVEPAVVAYTSAIGAMGRCGKVELAESLFEEMRQSETKTLKPDAFAYSALISALAQQGDVHRILKVLREMEDDGFTANQITFNSIITACVRTEQLEMAFRVVKLMLKRGLTPDDRMYNDLVRRQSGMDPSQDGRQIAPNPKPPTTPTPHPANPAKSREVSPPRTPTDNNTLRIGMTADMEIVEDTPLGYRVRLIGVVDPNHEEEEEEKGEEVHGLLHRNTLGSESLAVGEVVKGHVSYIRPQDGKVAVSLGMPGGYRQLSGASEKIMAVLKNQDTFRINLCDKSPPKDIENVFGMSKSTFKQALGKLYKSKLINIVNPGSESRTGYIELKL